MVQSISTSLNSIGYSGIGYTTPGVRALPLATKEGAKPVEATEANALNKSYPLSRYLYVYVNQEPDKALAPIEREFIKLILSKQGQQVVVKDGYVPLPASVAAEDLAKIK